MSEEADEPKTEAMAVEEPKVEEAAAAATEPVKGEEVEENMPVPKNMVGKIIGSGGATIQSLEHDSGSAHRPAHR